VAVARLPPKPSRPVQPQHPHLPLPMPPPLHHPPTMAAGPAPRLASPLLVHTARRTGHAARLPPRPATRRRSTPPPPPVRLPWRQSRRPARAAGRWCRLGEAAVREAVSEAAARCRRCRPVRPGRTASRPGRRRRGRRGRRVRRVTVVHRVPLVHHRVPLVHHRVPLARCRVASSATAAAAGRPSHTALPWLVRVVAGAGACRR